MINAGQFTKRNSDALAKTAINKDGFACNIRPTERELRWFAHIDRHGPQSSEFLFEQTRDTHRCRDTSLRRLQALRQAGYLFLPKQQQQIAKAAFNPYVYDLTRLGWDTLSDQKDLERHARPTGHWWHGYWVSAISSAIEITAKRAGLTFIPASSILAINDSELGIPMGCTKLIPDQLFAIKYADGYRAFALEVDRGTEPIQSNAARKSIKRSVHQYRDVLCRQLHKQHYGLKSNLIVLWVFSSRRRQRQFEELLKPTDRAIQCASVVTDVPRFESIATAVNVHLSFC